MFGEAEAQYFLGIIPEAHAVFTKEDTWLLLYVYPFTALVLFYTTGIVGGQGKTGTLKGQSLSGVVHGNTQTGIVLGD